ncbi:pilus assembly protein TadG-related protein [Streptomyces sp. LHD-70]|uniref:TadE/TadG family type IV pilus assembly protein n=1 Tax=Streptomyces sp. LHD-70 TaxID=3072140 RepID=UPI00280EBF5B|nr:pilus assembly protein TadG-related protein [Streptomyces sp. LHD-70]MDQ8707522.1 pilus assembly protein TadG-related protein [Streptomyces sp. LHD-70]
MNPGWWARRRAGEDRGHLELFYAGTVLLAFLIIGLVIDVGTALNTRSEAYYTAQEAARAGAQQLDAGEAISGDAIVVDPDGAQAAARAFLDGQSVDGDVSVSADGKSLNVTVHDHHEPIFASLLGIGQIPVTGHGSATLLHQPGG